MKQVLTADNIIFENDQFIAINKPSGLLSVPDRKQSEPSLKDMLLAKYGSIFTVHRLDKDTSGVIVFAKDEETHKALSALFEGREVEKYYQGMVYGIPYPEKGSVDAAIMEHPAGNGKMITHAKGKASLTDYEVQQAFRLYSWLKFQIHTGRTHQIRVHMQHLGHAIVCDDLYSNGEPIFISALKKKNYNLNKNELNERPILGRLALHSWLLKFELNGEVFELEAPLPKDLRATLQQLEKHQR
ncbi:23S rRNA pseudouridine955/2504/2580 synthase/23S rRNA pseudouridine1911/1915/1917 synthase [Filimonas lacunae]|uniref:Pseudouridine synthase n=1 Tax=Filimonas lacunae TaxID=477680 RepID=A0A173MMX0_9BACT|nr:RluA family pseudouridine synthase [Filimonas lacunae]BAV08984.1 ribosomal large subunit pseudouridine synthase D [Filimonas lacunae]SIS65259.1 23S rRNA pseudouridine955/2504/2580 synthase/23S rRNA pseudouridine1911/1915/1917 synthase [Filimonas lacunae]